jgi:molybdate transport system substrate-binding protein
MILAILAMTGLAAAETIQLYAAGSLKAALTDVSKAYEASNGSKVEGKYGPSGLLKDEIAHGAKADIFASANMEHPQALSDQRKGGPVVRFAVESKNLLERMLEKDVKVGTSTPRADPSGDYAFEVFRKADAIKAGAQAELEKKALQLTGSANSVPAPAGRTVYGWHVSEGRADIFLTYCTNALVAQKENPDQRIVDLPDNLAVGADYGLTVITGAPSAARHLADFIVSPEGQKILERHGFTPGNEIKSGGRS